MEPVREKDPALFGFAEFDDDPWIAGTPEVPELPPLNSILTPEQDEKLADQIGRMLDGYDEAMKDRWDREALIEECYNLVPQTAWQGQYEDAAELISEALMAAVDQAHARITGQLLSVEPFAVVRGVESRLPQDLSKDVAEALQVWLDRYLRHALRIECKASEIIYPVTKFGTAVVSSEWNPTKEDVDWKVLQNCDVVAWPPWEPDWKDLEWAGYRSLLTLSQFRRLVAQYGIEPELAEKVIQEASPTSADDDENKGFKALDAAAKIDAESVTTIEQYNLVSIYRIFGNTILPGEEMPRRFQLFYHRGLKRILWSSENNQRSGRHPLNPIRYKIPGATAWGQGVGHEMLPNQAKATMHDNLETDVLKSSSFGLNIVKESSIMDALWDHPAPGSKIPASDPSGDFVHVNLADSAPLQMLELARQANERSKIAATGQASVLQGQGDPTQKSGAGTGSTMALIAEANKKFGQIDRNIRNDFAELCLHSLEIAQQYGGGKPFAMHLDEEQLALVTESLLSLPSDRPISYYLKISIEAPSASNNDEMRRQQELIVYQMLQQHAAMMIQQYGAVVLQQTNPAAMVPYVLSWADVLGRLGERILTDHEIPGMKGRVPDLAAFVGPNPDQAQMNVLIGQLQQAQALIQQLAANQSPASGGGGARGVVGATESASSPSGAGTS